MLDDLRFWLVFTSAVILRLIFSEQHSFFKTVTLFGSALFAAIIFPDPILDYMNWDQEVYRDVVVALCALTGEGIIRWIITTSNKPGEFITKFFKGIVGK